MLDYYHGHKVIGLNKYRRLKLKKRISFHQSFERLFDRSDVAEFD